MKHSVHVAQIITVSNEGGRLWRTLKILLRMLIVIGRLSFCEVEEPTRDLEMPLITSYNVGMMMQPSAQGGP